MGMKCLAMLKYAQEDPGLLFVILTGVKRVLKLFVGNLDIQLTVSFLKNFQKKAMKIFFLYLKGAEAYGASYFGQDVAPIQYTNVQCNGDESSITACSNSSTVPTTCNTKSLAGVKCFEKSQCEDNGFTSCCSSSCNVGGCYCDLACHTFQDCCDIDNTCPSSCKTNPHNSSMIFAQLMYSICSYFDVIWKWLYISFFTIKKSYK